MANPLNPRRQGSAADLRDAYIELLIGALTHTLYAELDLVDVPDEIREALEEEMKTAEDAWILGRPDIARAQGRDWPRLAQTMVGIERLRNVRFAVERVIAERIPGDLIEAGTWRGGVGILMRGLLRAHGVTDRRIYLADSFQGLPEPSPDYPADEGDRSHAMEPLSVSVEEVRENFRRYGLLDDTVQFVEGWFRDTLPPLRGREWAVVRLDGDMYESTMDGLTNLYPGLAPGGFLIVDDYALPPCLEAVEDYRREHGITEKVHKIDWVGAYWRKRGATLRRAPRELSEKAVETARRSPLAPALRRVKHRSR